MAIPKEATPTAPRSRGGKTRERKKAIGEEEEYWLLETFKDHEKEDSFARGRNIYFEPEEFWELFDQVPSHETKAIFAHLGTTCRKMTWFTVSINGDYRGFRIIDDDLATERYEILSAKYIIDEDGDVVLS